MTKTLAENAQDGPERSTYIIIQSVLDMFLQVSTVSPPYITELGPDLEELVMAVLAAILPLVSRSASLALELYRFATSESGAAAELNSTAKSISNFALILKQVGTIIKEDDRLPSHEAIESLEDIVEQARHALNEIEEITALNYENTYNGRHDRPSSQNNGFRSNPGGSPRLAYLTAHLDALKSTLSVLLQSLYTAQSTMWAKVRPTISPQQAANAVANERIQLEILTIEQQMAILNASKLYEPSESGMRLLTETDTSQSLVSIEEAPSRPADLYHYQDRFIASMDTSDTTEDDWLPAVCGISKSQPDRLLDRWTRLRDFEEKLHDDERKARAKQREGLQAFVESDSEDDVNTHPKLAGNGTRLAASRPQFEDKATLPIPVPRSNVGPTSPLSPASSYGGSPKLSGNKLHVPTRSESVPASPRSSNSSIPVEAAAAVKAQNKDDDVDLEIPWTLCTRRYYWKYVDGKVKDTNSDLPPSYAFSDRNSWTEILASWVSKEAIKEAGYNYAQVQKDRRDGRRTRFEPCFCIQHALTFNQIQQLVERTVEMYRETKPPSPPPRAHEQERVRRSRSERPSLNFRKPGEDRDRTLVANQHHPPPDRSSTSYPFPPPPPSLDRSLSMPGTIPQKPGNPRASTSNLTMPPPQLPYTPHIQQQQQQPAPHSPHGAQYPPYPNAPNFYAQQQPFHALAPHRPNTAHGAYPQQSSLRQSFRHDGADSKQHEFYSSTSATSDSDTAPRSRKHRSRSGRPVSRERRKKGHGHGAAMGALMGVGGLTALLDGLAGL